LLNAHVREIREIIETNTGNRTTVVTKQNESNTDKYQNFDEQKGHEQKEQQQQKRPRKDEVDVFIHQLRLGIQDSA